MLLFCHFFVKILIYRFHGNGCAKGCKGCLLLGSVSQKLNIFSKISDYVHHDHMYHVLVYNLQIVII